MLPVSETVPVPRLSLANEPVEVDEPLMFPPKVASPSTYKVPLPLTPLALTLSVFPPVPLAWSICKVS